VEAIMSVGDDVAAIKNRLDFLLSMTDAVICSGGLGPTSDDITTAAIAEAFALPLYTDENVLSLLKTFSPNSICWVENNAKQAVFPRELRFYLTPEARRRALPFFINGKMIFVIPGVPAEAKLMVVNVLFPPCADISRRMNCISSNKPLGPSGFPKPPLMKE